MHPHAFHAEVVLIKNLAQHVGYPHDFMTHHIKAFLGSTRESDTLKNCTKEHFKSSQQQSKL